MTVRVAMFASDTCGPCKLMKPVLLDVCDKAQVPVSITHITKDSPEIAQYGIRSVPTTVFFEDGVAMMTKTGFMTKAQIDATLHRFA